MYRLANFFDFMEQVLSEIYHLLHEQGPTYSTVKLIFVLGWIAKMTWDLWVVDFIQTFKRA